MTGSIEFEQGAVGTIVTSFATRFLNMTGRIPITIFGTDGTMLGPGPEWVWRACQTAKKGRCGFC